MSQESREPHSEVHSTYIKLTWQNLFSFVGILIAGVVMYMQLKATDDSLATKQNLQSEVLKRVIDIQDRQQDWLTEIAIKTGTPPPKKTNLNN